MSITYFEIIDRMNKLNLIHRINIQTEAAKHELYLGQFPILKYVKENDGCTQKDVAKFLGISPPSIATSVKRMQKAGILDKENDPTDGRLSRLSITKKGAEVYENCKKGYEEIDSQLFSDFSEEECQALYGLIGRMIFNLSRENYENKTFFSIMEDAKDILKENGND